MATIQSEVKNLSYSVEQLCSDVESSIAGQNGSHRNAIARVRRSMKAVEELLEPKKWDGKTHTGSCGSPYGSNCPCGN